jgi:hypothetical protein
MKIGRMAASEYGIKKKHAAKKQYLGKKKKPHPDPGPLQVFMFSNAEAHVLGATPFSYL